MFIAFTLPRIITQKALLLFFTSPPSDRSSFFFWSDTIDLFTTASALVLASALVRSTDEIGAFVEDGIVQHIQSTSTRYASVGPTLRLIFVWRCRRSASHTRSVLAVRMRRDFSAAAKNFAGVALRKVWSSSFSHVSFFISFYSSCKSLLERSECVSFLVDFSIKKSA